MKYFGGKKNIDENCEKHTFGIVIRHLTCSPFPVVPPEPLLAHSKTAKGIASGLPEVPLPKFSVRKLTSNIVHVTVQYSEGGLMGGERTETFLH